MKRSLLNLVCVLAGAPALAALPVDYLREVKPLFAANCYRCHGASQQKSELRMDTTAAALKGGGHGPAFKPGKSSESLVVQTLRGEHDSIPRMPFKKPPLNNAQVALIARWIDEGGNAPADELPEKNTHWAFLPPARVAPPVVRRTAWPRNAIDNFILARLEKENIRPSREANRVTLIRRLSLDLTGLPPSPAEVDAFVNDRSPGAYENLVERLLASPHYGERWGRHWLDVARYADSNGYSIDALRSIWKYRDWVIHALNRDLPFDQFVIEQLAGDLLPNATVEQKVATGFNRNTQINQEGGIDPEQFRVESVMDRVNTTATAFLGVTLACAQCHDHKFDPFTQRDYYQFYAFFNNTIEDGHGKGAPEGMLEIPGENEAADNLQKELEEAEGDLERLLNTQGSEVVKWEQALTAEEQAKLKPDVRKALEVPFAGRTTQQKRTVYAAFRADDPEFKQRNAKLTKLEKRQPKPISTLVMVEQKEPRESVIFIKGDFTRRGAVLTPGVPAVLDALNESRRGRHEGNHSSGTDGQRLKRPHPTPLPQEREKHSPAVQESRAASAIARTELSSDATTPPPLPEGEGRGEGEPTTNSQIRLPNRLDLAHWIVETNNPLTARVIVNRIWQQYFGRGLVETENDFGTQGSLPTHPELLDWLACELMRPTGASALSSARGERRGEDETRLSPNAASPWSLKHLHRLIVTSAAYRQSSKARPDLATTDPINKLLARQNRLRLDAEIVRDVCLTASGLMNGKIGGPSVFPPQPDGVMNLGQSRRDWKPSTGDDRYRRGLYTYFWRATPHPALAVFDAPDAFSTCTRRLRSNTPLQALTLLNDQQFYELAQALAVRVQRECPSSDAERLNYAFRLCTARGPQRTETKRLRDLLAAEVVSGAKAEDAWTTVARVLLNLDETITRE